MGTSRATSCFASALGVFVATLGHSVGLTELLVINIGVSLLAGVLPIPGGVGVVEGGLTFGLVQAGVPEETAFAAVLLYRLSTFYLPPIWGFFAPLAGAQPPPVSGGSQVVRRRYSAGISSHHWHHQSPPTRMRSSGCQQ